MMELHETVCDMLDECYKKRFRAEYWQLRIRIEKLTTLVIKYREGTLGFQPSCSLDILENQLYAMQRYLSMLELRAEIEKVNLE